MAEGARGIIDSVPKLRVDFARGPSRRMSVAAGRLGFADKMPDVTGLGSWIAAGMFPTLSPRRRRSSRCCRCYSCSLSHTIKGSPGQVMLPEVGANCPRTDCRWVTVAGCSEEKGGIFCCPTTDAAQFDFIRSRIIH